MRRGLAHISEAIVKDGFYPFSKARQELAEVTWEELLFSRATSISG